MFSSWGFGTLELPERAPRLGKTTISAVLAMSGMAWFNRGLKGMTSMSCLRQDFPRGSSTRLERRARGGFHVLSTDRRALEYVCTAWLRRKAVTASHMVRRGSYQGCKIYLKLFLGRPLESAKPLKFLWKAFPELSDASGRQPRGTKKRPGTPPVCFKGSHGQPKRAQRRPKTVQVAAEMPKESYRDAVCNAFSQRCVSEWRFKQLS